MCGAECESVVHVLWECTAYSSSRASFTEKLQELLGDSYADFELLSSVEKTSYVLGSEHWEKKFKSLLFRVYFGHVNMAMTHALVIFSPSPRLGIWGCHWS